MLDTTDSQLLVGDGPREELFYYFLNEGIHTEDQLWFFIRTYLNFRIPRHSVCPEHCSQFQFIADQYFERHRSVLGFANRTGGKTISTAILNVVEALTKPGIEITSAGAILEQANRGYDYVVKLVTGDPLIAQQVQVLQQKQTIFSNGSRLAVIAGTFSGMNSPHPTKSRVDEIELMYWSVLQEGMQMSMSKGRWQAGDCFTSTRKFSTGTMQRMLDEAPQRGIKVLPWCIWEVLEPCTRKCQGDPIYGDCRAFSRRNKEGIEEPLCGGKAHDLPSGGFYKIDDFVKKVSLLDRDTFDAQWLNKRPTAGALVYGNFYKDEYPFIVGEEEAARILKRILDEHWERVYAIDFGSNFYTGYYAIDPYAPEPTWYQYAEYWFSSHNDQSLRLHAEAIKTHDPLGFSDRAFCYADPSGRQAIRDLQDYGIFAEPANNDLYSGINDVKKGLERRKVDNMPSLRIFEKCVRIRKELSELYVHRLDKSGEPMKDVVVKQDDHGADCLRYAIRSYQTLGGTIRGRRLVGV